MKRFWILLLIISFLIILDQFVKGAIQTNFQLGESVPVIKGFFSLSYVQNTGIAFGIGSGSSEWFRVLMFIALPCLICIALFYFMIKEIKKNFWLPLAYALILAGAIGNLIDRFLLGYVVDMFHFYWKSYHFHVFNIADSVITIGAVILGIDQVFLQKKDRSEKKLS